MCDLAKIFFTSKFSYLLFCNPSHKSETGIANRWGTSNIKPPEPIIMMGRSESLSCSEIILLHTCRPLVQLLGLVSQYKLCNYAEPRLFSSPKPAYFDFSSSNATGRVTYWAQLEMFSAHTFEQRIWDKLWENILGARFERHIGGMLLSPYCLNLIFILNFIHQEFWPRLWYELGYLLWFILILKVV
jgi:hypothetical protein